jgi:hypothetical protein
METHALIRDMEILKTHIQMTFEEMLYKQDEFIIFDELDLATDTPDDYLEMRNEISGNVFDVHPLKVSKEGIEVVEADGSFTKHTIKIWDLSIEDRINLLQLMENCLVD